MAREMGIDISYLPAADIERVASLLNEAGLTGEDADVAAHVDAAAEVLRERGLFETRTPEIRTSVHEEGGFSGVTMILYVNSNPSDVMILNKALARKERQREVKKHLMFDVVIASSE